MSAFPPEADIRRRIAYVCFVKARADNPSGYRGNEDKFSLKTRAGDDT
jgi:hypothetical protein